MLRQTPQNSLATFLLAALIFPPSSQNPAQTGQHSEPKSETSQALEFLGSYSAPSAIEATETSHTSAHPPSPTANRRLRRIERGFDVLAPWPWDFTWGTDSMLAACAPVNEESRRDISLAGGALRAQHFEDALAAYDRLARANAGCPAVSWNHAVAAAYAHSPAAVSNLTAAFPDAPSPALGHLVVGLAQLSTGDVAGARPELLQAFEVPRTTQAPANATRPPSGAAGSPPERDLVWAHAMLAEASGEAVKARQDLENLSKTESDCLAVWFALGGAALEEARAASRRLAEIAPNSEWNHRLQAQAVAARYPALAQDLWQDRLRGAPENPGGAAAPGSDLKAAESPESLYQQAQGALRLSQDAYSRASPSPQFGAYLHALKALAAEQENDEAAAFREYQEGLARNPDSAILHAGLGHLYRQRLDLKAAQPELERARKLDPTDPLIGFELGDLYQRLGQAQQALRLLNEVLQLDSEFLLARWSRGKAYLALGDTERALGDLEAAAPVDTTGDLQFQLARLYQKLGRLDLAEQAQKRSEEQREAVHGKQ